MYLKFLFLLGKGFFFLNYIVDCWWYKEIIFLNIDLESSETVEVSY